MEVAFDIEQILSEKLKKWDLTALRKFSEELSSRYREGQKKNYISKQEHRLAYFCFRFPATAAAVGRVLQEIPLENIKSFLDVGAGPGTASYVLKKQTSSLKFLTLLEKDAAFAELGKEILGLNESLYSWKITDLEKNFTDIAHDVVLFSYSLGELTDARQETILADAWKVCKKFLILIEPGTPEGFARIRKARTTMLEKGAHMVAPCPGAYSCPIAGSDWCHFSTRVSRTSLHRQIKSGSLGYEDEKFSYLIFSKEPFEKKNTRIVRHPLKKPGHVVFKVCTESTIKDLVVTKKNPENYSAAKKAEWGDAWSKA